MLASFDTEEGRVERHGERGAYAAVLLTGILHGEIMDTPILSAGVVPWIVLTLVGEIAKANGGIVAVGLDGGVAGGGFVTDDRGECTGGSDGDGGHGEDEDSWDGGVSEW